MNVSLSLSGNKANFSIEMFETIHRAEFLVTLKISSLGKNSYREMVRKTINVCNFLKNPRSEFGFNAWYQEALKAGFPIRRCPIQPVCLKHGFMDNFETLEEILVNFPKYA